MTLARVVMVAAGVVVGYLWMDLPQGPRVALVTGYLALAVVVAWVDTRRER